MPVNKAHVFQRNTFNHIYCKIGCAYHVTGTMIQQFAFQHNHYSIMVATEGSAVFFGSLDLQASNALAQVWVQSYRNETFDKIFGGTIELSGQNVPVTIIENSKFINTLGLQGAAINLVKGGGLYVQDTEFTFVIEDDQLRYDLVNAESYEAIQEVIN